MKTLNRIAHSPTFLGGILPGLIALAVTAASSAPFYLG
jgi:hypothetical protein